MGLCASAKNVDTGDDDDVKTDLIGGNVHQVCSKEVWEQKISEASEKGKLVVANFSVPWCGPCKRIAPEYCQLSEKYASFVFLTVDADSLSDFSASWDIQATPTFFFIRDGKQIDKLVGANKDELENKLAKFADESTQL